jgi:hypothetical protein
MPMQRSTSGSLAPRVVLLGSGLILFFVVFRALPPEASAAAGCIPAEPGSIAESQAFNPASSSRALPELPLDPSGLVATSFTSSRAPSSVDGRDVQFVVEMPTGDVYAYYATDALGPEMTPSEFFRAGGVLFQSEAITDGGTFAEAVAAVAGDRAVRVDVGAFGGVMTWADPSRMGVRTHNLYWSDGKSNFALLAERTPEQLVNLARAYVCGK